MSLFTIGYERASFDAFATTLADAGVCVLVDVRAQPHSRRREFAFKHLGPALDAHGIRYESWPELGTPAAGREAAKRGELETFARIFEAQLATPEARDALERLCALSRRERVCLMCYERDPRRCHRSIVAERVTAMSGDDVQHLYVADA